MKEADRIERGIITAEGVGAYELGKTGGFMRLGRDKRPHFVDDDRHAAHGRLPRRFRAGKAPANDMDGFRHGRDSISIDILNNHTTGSSCAGLTRASAAGT